MAGPCSLPAGDKRQWEEHNQMVCNIHQYCWMNSPYGNADTRHEFVTLRVWLAQRKRLRTGKTR